jgi:alpha-L-fucosidase
VLLGAALSVTAAGASEPRFDIETPPEAIEAWQDLRFGLFIHWGVYSIPAGVWEGRQIEKLGEQIQRHADISMAGYENIARQFNPVEFDADAIARLARQAGMRYIVFTAKHHDGFAMFDSAHTDFDIVDFTPYSKDILAQLAEACMRHGLKLGIYYSTPDWHFNGPEPERNPRDGKLSVFSKVSKENEDYQVAQLQELLSNYGGIVELFFDMGEPTAEQSRRFRNTVKRLQPGTLINGRVMNGQGDFLTLPDNHVPDLPITELPWETPGTFYHTWGYKSWVVGKPVPEQVRDQVRKLSRISSMGGNFLLNIGPKADGTVLPYEQEVLAGVGDWLQDHGEAIFDAGINPFVNPDWGTASVRGNRLYLHVHRWPEDGRLVVPGLSNTVSGVVALGGGPVTGTFRDGHDFIIPLQDVAKNPSLTILALDFEGELAISAVRAEPDTDGVIVLRGDQALKHHQTGRESYRSLLKDYYRSWLLEVPAADRYRVDIRYSMKHPEKDFSFEAGRGKETSTLTGGAGIREASLGLAVFDSPGLQSVYLRPGKPFGLPADSDSFHAQDPAYRNMGIQIETITLTPEP